MRTCASKSNVGFVRNVNQALVMLAPADVIVLNSDCEVAEGWYEGLRSAAYSDTRVATASALTNHGSILSVPERNRPLASLPPEWSLDSAARAVQAASPRIHPTLPAAVGHCFYLKRSALDLVGALDEEFAPGYEEEVDFSQRCTRYGLVHVLADDVFVLHRGGGSFEASGGAAELRLRNHRTLLERYPYWDRWVKTVERADRTPLARSLSAGRRALRAATLTVDARVLTEFMTGTQLHVLEVIAAVHDLDSMAIRVLVPQKIGDYAAEYLESLDRVRLVTEKQARREPPTDVVHRPYQTTSAEDVRFLRSIGHRLVITHQDLIAFHNPAYHAGFEQWLEHRAVTRTALAAADRVAFFSRHARSEAIAEELVDPPRARVVLLGTDHRITVGPGASGVPSGADRWADRPFLLCLGTDFVHKNRVFAIRLLAAMNERHGYKGDLILAGPHVASGSSARDEAEELGGVPGLAQRVADIGAVDEAGKRWLMQRADAVVYPTTYEGFGLVPFEAGDAEVPCFFAPTTALAELLPRSAALLVPWDAAASADRCAELLADPDRKREHVRALRAAGAGLTWRRTGAELLDLYEDAMNAPSRDALGMIETLAQGTHLDPYSEALVGPDGVLPAEMVRPLLAISQSSVLRRMVFGTLRAGHLAGRSLRALRGKSGAAAR